MLVKGGPYGNKCQSIPCGKFKILPKAFCPAVQISSNQTRPCCMHYNTYIHYDINREWCMYSSANRFTFSRSFQYRCSRWKYRSDHVVQIRLVIGWLYHNGRLLVSKFGIMTRNAICFNFHWFNYTLSISISVSVSSSISTPIPVPYPYPLSLSLYIYIKTHAFQCVLFVLLK